MLTIVHVTDLHLQQEWSQDFWDTLPPSLLSLAKKLRIPRRCNQESLRALSGDLARLQSRLARPTLYVVSGDIAMWPYPRTTLDNFYRYLTSEGTLAGTSDVAGLRIPSDSLVTVLGNHDLLARGADADYEWSQFGVRLSTHLDRVEFRRHGTIPIVTFHLNSMVLTIPPIGWITGRQIAWLQQWFTALESGAITLPSGKPNRLKSNYAQAIKLLVLHHSPLNQGTYPEFTTYFFHQLCRRDYLGAACAGHVDAVLFGHTHRVATQLWNGMIAIDGGTIASETMGTSRSDHDWIFRVLTFDSARSCHIETFCFNGWYFESRPPVVDFHWTPTGYAMA